MGAEVNQGFNQFASIIPRKGGIMMQSRVPTKYGKLFRDFQDAHRLNWRRTRLIPDKDNRWYAGYNKPPKSDLLIYMLEIGREAFEKEIESLLK